jgi:hypothetical protein
MKALRLVNKFTQVVALKKYKRVQIGTVTNVYLKNGVMTGSICIDGTKFRVKSPEGSTYWKEL